MLGVRIAAALVARANDVSLSIVKRGEAAATYVPGENPKAFLIFFLVNFIVFLPVSIYMSYTLGAIFPVLAIVESNHKYEQLPIKEDDDNKNTLKVQPDSIEEPDSSENKPITSSIRATHRLLWSINGIWSLYRAFGWFLLLSLSQGIISGLLAIPMIPYFLNDLVATILSLQLNLVWLHYVISSPSKKKGITRVPGFMKTLRVTALPAFVSCIAVIVSELVPRLTMMAMQVEFVRPVGIPVEVPSPDTATWKTVLYFGMWVMLLVIISLPIQAVLARCQASMLPPEDETIIPVDRTFGVEKAREQGYISALDAFKSLKNSWGRLYKLCAKIVLITICIYVLIFIIMAVEVFFINLYLRKD